MALPPIRIAAVASSPLAAQPPAIVTGSRRAWLRGGRPEPFAACLSVASGVSNGAELARLAHEVFEDSRRRSLTSGLTRALLAVHTSLAQDQPATAEADQWACGMAAALRPSGLYVAQMGPGLICNARLATVWARSWEPATEPIEPSPSSELVEVLPAVTTEFFPLSPGDALLFLPGLTGDAVAEGPLSRALHVDPQAGVALDAVGELLTAASGDTAAVVVWWPEEARAGADQRWRSWPDAASTLKLPRAEPASTAAEESEPRLGPAAALGKALTLPRLRLTRGLTASLASAAVLAVLAAITMVRSLAPDPTAAEAATLIARAEATSEQAAAVALLEDAIARLQPRAARDEQALALLERARARRDQVLNVVRVGEIERFALPPEADRRPLGLWKSDDTLLMLDLGAQALLRSDLTGARLETAVRPGESVADRPLGSLVSAAFSPPRGVNTDGRLLVVDTARSILSIGPSGARRWWPPDGDQWGQIGPSAATFDHLFLLDTARNVIWQYPARVALARGTVAATAQDEPRLGQALDLATDGNLYLLLSGGAIRKLAPGGGSLPFEMNVPGQPIQAATALFAHPDLDHLWVLEPAASRVVELTTGGAYVRQYVFPPNVVRQGVSLHVDTQAGELRVLTTEHVVSVKIE